MLRSIENLSDTEADILISEKRRKSSLNVSKQKDIKLLRNSVSLISLSPTGLKAIPIPLN